MSFLHLNHVPFSPFFCPPSFNSSLHIAPAFALAFGQVIAEAVKETPQLPAYAVTVGKKPTAAAAYIDDPAAVLELLHSLSKYSEKDKRYFSAMDLPSQANTGGLQGGLGEWLAVLLTFLFTVFTISTVITVFTVWSQGACVPYHNELFVMIFTSFFTFRYFCGGIGECFAVGRRRRTGLGPHRGGTCISCWNLCVALV